MSVMKLEEHLRKLKDMEGILYILTGDCHEAEKNLPELTDC